MNSPARPDNNAGEAVTSVASGNLSPALSARDSWIPGNRLPKIEIEMDRLTQQPQQAAAPRYGTKRSAARNHRRSGIRNNEHASMSNRQGITLGRPVSCAPLLESLLNRSPRWFR